MGDDSLGHQSCHPNQAPNHPGRVPNDVDVGLQQNNSTLNLIFLYQQQKLKERTQYVSLVLAFYV